jgi:hypothetical protein
MWKMVAQAFAAVGQLEVLHGVTREVAWSDEHKQHSARVEQFFQ